jgi:hypothetical protein
MIQHPQILRSLRKEVHYFDGGGEHDMDNYEKGLQWYRAHFPYIKSVNGNCITGEASPEYIFHPLAAARIYSAVPQVKMICLLRNPTERAISHYFHAKRKGHEKLSISNALHEEEKRMKHAINNQDYRDSTFIHSSYKHRGLYKEQLERYLEYFSREQLLVLESDELFGKPEFTLRKVFQFLEVDSEYKVKDLKPRHIGSNKKRVDSEVYQYLDEYFSPHNQALYDLIGEEFCW